MSWQNPKTDWSAADGVRDTDMNRIESNILELYKADAVRSDATIYVSTSGNDTSGLGTTASPYRTITKALSALPKNLNGKTVTINIAAGNYDDDVVVQYFCGGMLKFTGSGIVAMNSLVVAGCTLRVESIGTLSLTGGTGLDVTNGGAFITPNSNIKATDASIGISASECSRIYIGGNVELVTVTTGIIATKNSSIYVDTITGSDVGTSMSATSGGTIAYGTHGATARATYVTTDGGRVNTGSQSLSPGNVL